ncbi:MAG: hypothetical protein Q7S01_05085 [bacterium]|nr:hypothetical protein [bacterium]
MSRTQTLGTLLERAESWPEEAQAELLQFMVNTETKHFGVYRLSDDERAAVRVGLSQAKKGKFASDTRVQGVFKKFRRA